MGDSLSKVEKNLKALAKRYESVRYSKGLAILFLMLGVNAFSEENVEDHNQNQNTTDTDGNKNENSSESISKIQIKSTATKLKERLEQIKKENEKNLSSEKLELIKLMEQGDQVVKSPWSSWQFGANTFQDFSVGKYKGHEDKVQNEILTRGEATIKDSTGKSDSLAKFVKGGTSLSKTSYNGTNLNYIDEPDSVVTVSAKIRPIVVGEPGTVDPPKADLPQLPSIEDRPLVTPKINDPGDPNISLAPFADFPGRWINGDAGRYSYWTEGNPGGTAGNLYQTSVERGDLLKRRISVLQNDRGNTRNKVYLKDYKKGEIQVRPINYNLVNGVPKEAPENALDGLQDQPDFFLSLDDIPYSYFGKDSRLAFINENNNEHGQIFIHFETEGNSRDKFEKLRDEKIISEEEYNEIRGYTNNLDYKNTRNGELYNVNRGTVELGGTALRYIQTSFQSGLTNRVNLIENRGEIVAMNYKEGNIESKRNVVFLYGPDTGGGAPYLQHIYSNAKEGKIDLYSEKSYLGVITATSSIGRGEVALQNNGEVNLYGRENVGFFIGADKLGLLQPKSALLMNAPINIQGDGTTGLYVLNSGAGIKNPLNTVKLTIGARNNSEIPAYVPKNYFLKPEYSLKPNHNKEGGDENLTEEAVGVYLKNPASELHVKVPQIDIEKFSKKSVGIFSDEGKIIATEGNINIRGGEGNVALYATTGNIDYTGDITLETSSSEANGGNKNGKGNMFIFSKAPNKTVTTNGKLIAKNSPEAIAIYSDNGKVDINSTLNLKLKAGDVNGSIGVYAKNSQGNNVVTINMPQTPEKSVIEIDGKNLDGKVVNQGVALYAKDAGKIVANGTSLDNGLKIKVTDGATAIMADGAGTAAGNPTKIEAKFSTVDYSGNGYALYSKDNGEIDVSNAEINLSGNATGFERSGDLTQSFNITLQDTVFKVHSNSVRLMKLNDITTLLASNLQQLTSPTYLGGARVEAINGATKFKIAAIDGLNLYDIDTNVDKSLAVDEANVNTNDYIFTKKLDIKRGKIVLRNGKTVKALLNTQGLDAIGEKTVVGLAMGSSAQATNNTETSISLEANSTVKASRIDDGNGAVGLYTNYGKIDIASGASVSVQKDSTSSTTGAVGIYSVNGSETSNSGSVDVGGKNSIGILGMAHRIDENKNIINDTFGDGKIKVENLASGKISLSEEEGVGIFINNNTTNSSSANYLGMNLGNIEITGDKSVGMSAKTSQIFNRGTIDIKSKNQGVGMFGLDGSNVTNEVTGKIELASAESNKKPNIGMYSKDITSTLENLGEISGGDNTYGIYSKDILTSGKISLGNKSVGVYSDTELEASNVDLSGEISVGNNSTAVSVVGKNSSIIDGSAKIKMGDDSLGYVLRTKGSTLNANSTDEVALSQNATFIFSEDKTANITNKTPLKSSGDKNYGAYVRGNLTNLADIDFSSGKGNIGIYHIRNVGETTGFAVNGQNGLATQPIIKVGNSDIENKFYSIGMAGGYFDSDTNTLKYTGQIENYGKINVVGDKAIGMYAAGKGSKAINHSGAEINLTGEGSIGMYLTDGATGENYGTIQTTADAKTGIKGVVVTGGAILKNYGTIKIEGKKNVAISKSRGGNVIEESGSNIAPLTEEIGKSDTSKEIKNLKIESKPDLPVKVLRNGVEVKPIFVDTNIASAKAPKVKIINDELDLKLANLADIPSLGRASSIGMYIDTSGINYTNPIEGLENLKDLEEIHLLVGTEATRYTNAIDIKIGENIISPYNKVIENLSLTGSNQITYRTKSASLTWIATPRPNDDGSFESIYLSKIPYTSFTKDKNTFNFADGLEQKYQKAAIGSREKELFNKLNGIGKGEPALLAQAVDEMMGHQYANTQQRVKETSDILDKEFNYLRKDWQNFSKDSNKIKTFGTRGKYETNTAGVIDYTNNAYGVAYVHEDETLNLGKTSGWYAGIVDNKFNFKDIGSSKEEQLQGKIGVFKSIPFDYDNSLNLTISGDLSVGYNRMNRRFLVVDEIFGAKAKYYTYAAGLKNELSKEIRLSEDFSFKPYAQARVEYGKVSKIKEKSGEMKLEVKANDYYSIKPEAGAELIFKYSFGSYKTVKAVLSAAYENELGKIADGRNQAKVADTSTDYFNIRGEKENREGNIKTDLKIGVDNSRVGLTANVGYDTKGQNIRGGVGVRFIF